MLVSTQLPHPATHTHTHVYCIICILLYLFHSLTVEYHSRLSNSWSVLLMVSKLSWCYIKQMSIRVYTLFKYRVQQQLLCKGNLEKYPVSMHSLILPFYYWYYHVIEFLFWNPFNIGQSQDKSAILRATILSLLRVLPPMGPWAGYRRSQWWPCTFVTSRSRHDGWRENVEPKEWMVWRRVGESKLEKLTKRKHQEKKYENLLLFCSHNRILKCDVIILQTFSFEPRHAIYTAAVRTCAKFQIASIMKVKIEMFEVLHSSILTSLI